MKTAEREKTCCQCHHISWQTTVNSGSVSSAVSDVFITCCTFGVLILLLRCLPLAASASFTVTACRRGKKDKCNLTFHPIDELVLHYFCTESLFILWYTIPAVASLDWECSPLPELPVCISLYRFLHPESPRCHREQPWGPRSPSPLVPLKPRKAREET